MVLGEQSIRSRNIIRGSRPGNFRGGSYDLVVRDVIAPNGEVMSEFMLPPQGVVKVISAEIVDIPPDVIGYVLVKTSLCNEGVLALNIGIVDPGFCGPLQSTLLNFGKSNVRIEAGDVFSRISFHSLDRPTTISPPGHLTHTSVRKVVREDSDRYLASTFLDIEKTSEKAAEKAFGNFKASMFKLVPVVAFTVALATFALNFGNMWAIYSYFKPQDIAKSEVVAEKLDIRLKQLETQNADLNRRLVALTASQPTTAK
jgi:dUTPase